MNKTITKEKVFNHSIDQIWNAITNAEEISAWFLKADFKAEVGYKYVFNSSEKNCSAIIGEVLEANPYTLTYTWIVKDTPAITKVTWKLENLGNATKLYLEHSGIENYVGDTAIAMFESFNGGWDNCINGLSTYLKEEVNAR
ncbi:SRPBCC domain-containing protein [Winogradskyella echinorum]|uniref:SRPBCC domain-containing protein n=1 Tax=Winogradskyella echinorum TaxID=538189 RepID=A0ABR6XY45_9FLAO|nr:SRPBCC domain-containing protein [Winogradskyella echinorum]MBC3845410.1 SRPBCC domain-containing protein [Winogradskyella echinorum]MBC5749758.1 SRPBCC domain-containing protein [Winogradskyella echinorum]